MLKYFLTLLNQSPHGIGVASPGVGDLAASDADGPNLLASAAPAEP